LDTSFLIALERETALGEIGLPDASYPRFAAGRFSSRLSAWRKSWKAPPTKPQPNLSMPMSSERIGPLSNAWARAISASDELSLAS